jgi:uncharacterized protein YdaU (DUF1376 family)
MNASASAEQIRLPFMPLYVADILASPKVQVMTAEQFGAYMLILLTCWHSGDCRVRGDDQSLGQVTRLGAARWKKIKGPVVDCLTIDGGFASNEKLKAVWSESIEAYRKNRDRASTAARKRWGSSAPGNAPSIPPSNAKERCSSNAILQLTSNTPPLEEEPPTPFAEGLPDQPDWLTIEADFLKRWNALEGASDRGHRLAMPNNLADRFRALWLMPGWPERADQAMRKLAPGLPSGTRISLRSFLEKDTTITEILGGTHDWTRASRKRVGLNSEAVSPPAQSEGGGCATQGSGEVVEL